MARVHTLVLLLSLSVTSLTWCLPLWLWLDRCLQYSLRSKTRLDTFNMSSASRRACRAVFFRHGGRRTSYSAGMYKFSPFYVLTYTNLVSSNEIY